MSKISLHKRAGVSGKVPAKSRSESELKIMSEYIRKITGSRFESAAFLRRAGIVTSRGVLAKPYRA